MGNTCHQKDGWDSMQQCPWMGAQSGSLDQSQTQSQTDFHREGLLGSHCMKCTPEEGQAGQRERLNPSKR